MSRPIPDFKPLLKAAADTYKEILANKGLLNQVGTSLLNITFKKDTGPEKFNELQRLADKDYSKEPPLPIISLTAPTQTEAAAPTDQPLPLETKEQEKLALAEPAGQSSPPVEEVKAEALNSPEQIFKLIAADVRSLQTSELYSTKDGIHFKAAVDCLVRCVDYVEKEEKDKLGMLSWELRQFLTPINTYLNGNPLANAMKLFVQDAEKAQAEQRAALDAELEVQKKALMEKDQQIAGLEAANAELEAENKRLQSTLNLKNKPGKTGLAPLPNPPKSYSQALTSAGGSPLHTQAKGVNSKGSKSSLSSVGDTIYSALSLLTGEDEVSNSNSTASASSKANQQNRR